MEAPSNVVRVGPDRQSAQVALSETLNAEPREACLGFLAQTWRYRTATASKSTWSVSSRFRNALPQPSRTAPNRGLKRRTVPVARASPSERSPAHADSGGTAYPRVGAPQPANRPNWFRVPAVAALRPDSRFLRLRESLRARKLSTVCEEAQCPNIGECWNGEHATATIMLLGDTCTRGCRFCAVKTAARPGPPDPEEPMNVAAEVASWDIDYVVLTSVDRDDLPDGGAAHFARTVQYLKQLRPQSTRVSSDQDAQQMPPTKRPLFVECLVSDFAGNTDAVRCLATSGLDVYAHNLETVERLQQYVRDPRANYAQSLFVLRLAKEFNPQLVTKSSLMLGLGETPQEVLQAMRDLRDHQVDVVTFGQYLRPTPHHLSVVEWIHPDQFATYRKLGEEMGFLYVASGPLVRSSYRAGEYMMTRLVEQRQQFATPT